jgi:membrane-bound acyltransferase YfiQ involved in biofilm formation
MIDPIRAKSSRLFAASRFSDLSDIPEKLALIERRTASTQTRSRPRELNHLFVSNVRFWSMLAIIAIHCASVFDLVHAHTQFRLAVVVPFKFATIGFFLISGFLLGERVDRRDPVQYFSRRVKRVFLPWLFWFSLYCAALLAGQFLHHHLGQSNPGAILCTVGALARTTLLHTPFWFVPNLLFSIAILLISRRHLYSLKLGAVLLAANLVYVVNIYKGWFPSSHTQAIFGFVFYLWLGSYCSQNFERVNQFLARIPAAIFVALSLATGIAAYGESYLLNLLNRPDPTNTLRLSNQIFSVCVVLTIFKFHRATWPNFVDVRRHTFGLYLAHPLAVTIVLNRLDHTHLLQMRSIYFSDAEGFFGWVAVFLLTYFSCLAVTGWLASEPRLQWMVGLNSQDAPLPLPAASLALNNFILVK